MSHSSIPLWTANSPPASTVRMAALDEQAIKDPSDVSPLVVSKHKARSLHDLLASPYALSGNLEDYTETTNEEEFGKHPLVTYKLVETARSAGRFIDTIAAKLWVPSLHTGTNYVTLQPNSKRGTYNYQSGSSQSLSSSSSVSSLVKRPLSGRMSGGLPDLKEVMPTTASVGCIPSTIDDSKMVSSNDGKGREVYSVSRQAASHASASTGQVGTTAFKPKSTRTISGKTFQMRGNPSFSAQHVSSALNLDMPSTSHSFGTTAPTARARTKDDSNVHSQLLGEHENTYLFDISAPPLTFYRHIPRIFGYQPPCLSGHTCTLVEDKIYMVGGKTPAGFNKQLYIFNCTTNVLTSPQVYGSGPPPLVDVSATYVPGNNHIYYFGGCDGMRCTRVVYILEIDTLTFHRPKVYGRLPDARRGHTAVLRQTRKHNMLRTQSLTVSNRLQDSNPEFLHAESNDSLRASAATASFANRRSSFRPPPPKRMQTTKPDIYPSDSQQFARPSPPIRSWSQAVESSDEDIDYAHGTSGPGNRPRNHVHSPLVDASDGHDTESNAQAQFPYTIYIFGGLNDDRKSFSDVWKLHISTNPYECKFSEVISLDKDTPIWPSARAFHTAHDYNGTLIVYGGTDGDSVAYDKIWSFDFIQEKWTMSVPRSSNPRCLHISAIYCDHLIVIGGHDGDKSVTSVDVLNMKNWKWHSRMCNGIQSSGQSYHKGVFHDGRFFIVGGLDPVHILAGLRIIEMPNVRL